MSFGNQTVTFRVVTGTGTYNELGDEIMNAPSDSSVAGCLHEPMNASEMPEWLTNISTQVWITTAPPAAAAIAAKSTGVLRVGGVSYDIIGGAQPNPDLSGAVHNVTILSKLQTA